jgi:hypothetical protein
MKSSMVALLGAIAGGCVALLAGGSLLRPPVVSVAPSCPFAEELRSLTSRVDQLTADVASLRTIPEPVRSEVDPIQEASLTELRRRVDTIESELIAQSARLDRRESRPAAPGVSTANAALLEARLRQLATDSAANHAGDRMALLKSKLDATDPQDATALFELAEWSEEQGLRSDSKRLLRMAIKADPDHAAAREKLGYRKFDGAWLTAREIERRTAGN